MAASFDNKAGMAGEKHLLNKLPIFMLCVHIRNILSKYFQIKREPLQLRSLSCKRHFVIRSRITRPAERWVVCIASGSLFGYLLFAVNNK